MAPEIALPKRTVNVSNLNFQPEKNGEELVERVDLSLEMLLEHVEVDQIVRTRWQDAHKVLWDDKGEPQLLDLGKLMISLEAEGTATLTPANGRKAIVFEGARMKKIRVEPMIGHRATLYCQVRVDPSGHLEELGAMRIATKCHFEFSGYGGKTKNEDQGELNV